MIHACVIFQLKVTLLSLLFCFIKMSTINTFSAVFFAHSIAQVFRRLIPQVLRVRIPLEA